MMVKLMINEQKSMTNDGCGGRTMKDGCGGHPSFIINFLFITLTCNVTPGMV